MSSRPTAEARTPDRIESAPSDGPIVRSWRYESVAGSAPDRRISERFWTSSGVKLPVMRPSVVMRAQIGPAVRRDLLHEVVDSAGVGGRAAGRARHDLHALGHLAVHHQRFLGRRRRLFDDLQFEETGGADDFLRALDVGDARQLHENLVAVGALLRDARFGDAQLVHAALDRLTRLDDRLVAEVQLDIRPHSERVDAVGAGAALEVRRHFVGDLAERRVLRGRHAFDADVHRVGCLDLRDRDVLGLQLFAQPLALLIRDQAERVFGLHAQHEMDAALQVQPELQRLVHQPGGLGDAVALRDERVDADRREDDEDGEHGDDFPAKIAHD